MAEGEKRFSQDFTHWTEALAHGMRLMIENDQTGTEYYATLQQVLNYIILNGGAGGATYGGLLTSEEEMNACDPSKFYSFEVQSHSELPVNKGVLYCYIADAANAKIQIATVVVDNTVKQYARTGVVNNYAPFSEISGGGGSNFVQGTVETTAALDTNTTHGSWAVFLPENYADFGTAYFGLLVLPYANTENSFVQIAVVFEDSEANTFSIRARWGAVVLGVVGWSPWRSVSGGSSTFTSDFVANPAFGKYTAGSTVPANGKTVNEVLLDAFSNYLSPAFTSFSSALATIVEVGTTLTSPQNFTFGVSNSGNIKPNTLKVTDTTAGTDLVTDAAISSPVSVPIGAVEKSLNGATNSWRASAQNTQDAWFNSPTFSVTWRLRTFHGAVDVEPLLSAEVRALTGDWDTVNSFAITLSKTRYCIALRSGKNLVSVITQNNENLRGNFVKRATQMDITLPDGTTAKYDIYDFASATIMNITATVTLS